MAARAVAAIGRVEGFRRWWPLLVVALVASLAPGIARAATSPAGALAIKVLSNRADLISGGNALVEVVLPAGTAASTVKVDDDGRDVTKAFAVTGRRFIGLVDGLAIGPNVLTARRGNGAGARITITNHPKGGPVFAGPQVQPWLCKAGSLDAQCNRPAVFTYVYKSTAGGSYQAYNPASPPTNVANTTTDEGKTVRHIVRVETGVIARDQYRIAVLFDPAKPAASALDGFNNKLVITHGASCDTAYGEADAPDVMNETALSRGFVTMSNALDNAGHNCNIITQAESLVMTKEHVVENYGELRYTIGSGCSGGSLVQYQIANAFPGVYQGILPQCSYPDAWSSAMQYEDYHLMLDYLQAPQKWEPGVAWTQREIEAVLGHPNPANPVSFTSVIPDSGKPNRTCPLLPPAKMYHPQTNKTGVRCTLADYMVNVFGRRAEDGFANVPWDNTGVQYGLRSVISGALTPAQFVDINAKIGGRTIDHEPQAARINADPFAIGAAYRSGAVTQGNNLDKVAIIDLRGPDPGAFHDVYRTYALRARLEREHGTAANQLIWRGPVALLGDATFVTEGIIAIDKWLAAVEADKSSLPLPAKIIQRRPAAVKDRCANGAGVEMPKEFCDGAVTSYTTPRIQAGMPFTDDVIKCQLKPMVRSDYFPAQFTDAQWAKLQTAYPTGVCGYDKPGVAQQGAVAWQTYQRKAGGEPLGAPPVSRAMAAGELSRTRPAAPGLPATGTSVPLAVVGLALLGLAVMVRRGLRSTSRSHTS